MSCTFGLILRFWTHLLSSVSPRTRRAIGLLLRDWWSTKGGGPGAASSLSRKRKAAGEVNVLERRDSGIICPPHWRQTGPQGRISLHPETRSVEFLKAQRPQFFSCHGQSIIFFSGAATPRANPPILRQQIMPVLSYLTPNDARRMK